MVKVLADVGVLGAAAAKGGLTLENALRPPTGKPAGPIVATAFSATGEELVTLDSHGQIVAFYLHLNRYVAVRRHGAKVVAMAFSPLRKSILYLALTDGSIEAIDVATRKIVGALKGHLHAAHTLACHPSQPLLLSHHIGIQEAPCAGTAFG